jgi:putative membrane protein
VLRVLQQPVVAGALFVGLIFVWLIPHVLFRAMVDARLYAVMNWSMVVDGLLFWALVLDDRPSPPARLSRSGRLLLAFLVQWPQVAGGALICFAGRVLYPYYGLCGRLYPAIDAQTDQQAGAFLIWFAGGMMSAIAALMILRTIWAEEEAQARRTIPGWDKTRTGVARPLL